MTNRPIVPNVTMNGKNGVTTVNMPYTPALPAEYIQLEFIIEKPRSKEGMFDVEMWPSERIPQYKARARWPYFGYTYAHGCGDSDRSVSTSGDVGGTDTTASTGDW